MTRFFSTRNPQIDVSLREAVLSGLASDGGLFIPRQIPVLSEEFLNNLAHLSIPEIGSVVSKAFFASEIPERELELIVERSMNFSAPLVSVSERMCALELYHGPSLAFKDFGARFMAQLMSWLIQGDSEPLHILVATSGDTGGAVALGFHNVPGIQVTILYPEGRVSELQERQLTTLSGNVQALKVQGSFDDCQRIVKEAFGDREISEKLRITTANSINISRLIPQTFYYFAAIGSLQRDFGAISGDDVVFSIPSGNFGNLTAGLLAKMMSPGLPLHISRFVAATNANDVVPRFLQTGAFEPRDAIPTISNAMDIGNPSNFERLKSLLGESCDQFKEYLIGYSYSDEQTRHGIRELWERYQYIADPHGAIGYLALCDYLKEQGTRTYGIFLETAHPIKFADDVEQCISTKIPAPHAIDDLFQRQMVCTTVPPVLEALKSVLLS
ncbi:MAG: threonine synthase [Bdellovibrionales bacterium]|nr:threonine synthase [Bdellovibrionales bacterium]